MAETVSTAPPPAIDAAAVSPATLPAPAERTERIVPSAESPTAGTAPAKNAQRPLDACSTEPPQPLTPEELTDRLVPSDPRLSPDGRHALFVVAPAGKKGEHKESALWLTRDGAPAKPFTAGTAGDHSPRWSPDGTQILFCSDRAERGQEKHKLYLIPAAGGEARPLGDLQGELSDPSWAPDGKTVAVLRKDPETPEEKKRKEERDDAVVVDEDLKRVRLWLVEVESGKARCLTFGGRNVWSYGWSPDGERLAVCTTHSPEINTIFSPADLWTVPAAGGAATRVTTFPMLADSPVFVESAGGPAIAVRANDFREDPTVSVWLVSLADGGKRKLLTDDSGEVEGLAPLGTTPGGLALRIVERTHGLACALDARTGKLTPLTPGGKHGAGSVVAGPSTASDGSRVAVVWSDGTTPEEVYLGAAGGDGTAVTELGKTFQGRLCPTETVTWRSTDGVEVEGILTYPAGYEAGKRYPLIVEAHGGPSWQWEDRAMLDWHDWAQYLASHGYAVLQPNPRGSTGYGAAFQKLLQDDVGGGEVEDLISGARAMVARGLADEGKLGIGGWSWGGYLTARTITKTQLFRAAMMGAGLSNMLSDHDIPYANLLYYPG